MTLLSFALLTYAFTAKDRKDDGLAIEISASMLLRLLKWNKMKPL